MKSTSKPTTTRKVINASIMIGLAALGVKACSIANDPVPFTNETFTEYDLSLERCFALTLLFNEEIAAGGMTDLDIYQTAGELKSVTKCGMPGLRDQTEDAKAMVEACNSALIETDFYLFILRRTVDGDVKPSTISQMQQALGKQINGVKACNTERHNFAANADYRTIALGAGS